MIGSNDNGRSFATQFTLKFVEPFLKSKSKVLEVGCGLGHLAVELIKLGHHVLGIDTSESAIEATRSKGVRAEQKKLEDLDESGFDAILFTRSLHHIHPIGSCLSSARQRLNAGGIVALEDFCFDRLDENSAIWYQTMRNQFGKSHNKPEWMAASENALTEWLRQHTHEHQLHRGEALEQAMRKFFEIDQVMSDVPYLFRYFVGPKGLDSQSVKQVFEMERDLIEKREIRGIGIRIIGS